MKTVTKYLMTGAVAALFAAAPWADLSAQAHPGNDLVSINAYGGGFSPTQTFQDRSEFDNSGTLGGAVTLWVHPFVGVRGNVLWSPTDVSFTDPASPLAGEDPNAWAYSGDLVLRLPFEAGAAGTLFPYIVGGLGGKTYDFETLSTETDFAGNFGAGLEYRPGADGRWGIQAEVRDIVSSFDRLGVDRTQHDLVWTGGITLNF